MDQRQMSKLLGHIAIDERGSGRSRSACIDILDEQRRLNLRLAVLEAMLRKIAVRTWMEDEGRDGRFQNTECLLCGVRVEGVGFKLLHRVGCMMLSVRRGA